MAPFEDYKQFEELDIDIDTYKAFSNEIRALNLKIMKGRELLLGKVKSPKKQANIKPKEDSSIDIERKRLLKMKMKELREIGYEYGAADTKKSELIEEILKAKYGGK